MFKKTFKPVWNTIDAKAGAGLDKGAGGAAKADVVGKGVELANAVIGHNFDVNIALAAADAAKTKSKSFST